MSLGRNQRLSVNACGPEQMPMKVDIVRDTGHPWDGRPGFDLLDIQCDTQQELESAVGLAAEKFWAPWIVGFTGDGKRPAGLLYKPSRIGIAWVDTPQQPHPGCREGVPLGPQGALSEEQVDSNTRRAIARQRGGQ